MSTSWRCIWLNLFIYFFASSQQTFFPLFLATQKKKTISKNPEQSRTHLLLDYTSIIDPILRVNSRHWITQMPQQLQFYHFHTHCVRTYCVHDRPPKIHTRRLSWECCATVCECVRVFIIKITPDCSRRPPDQCSSENKEREWVYML